MRKRGKVGWKTVPGRDIYLIVIVNSDSVCIFCEEKNLDFGGWVYNLISHIHITPPIDFDSQMYASFEQSNSMGVI